MKIHLVEPKLGASLLRVPSRRRLVARSTYPGVSRVWTSPGPLRRLAWVFGFGRHR
jgi:hypothetical protein